MQCSECNAWISPDYAGIAGMKVSDVKDMEVFCPQCMHGTMIILMKEAKESSKRQEELESTMKLLLSRDEELEKAAHQNPTRKNASRPVLPKLLLWYFHASFTLFS